MFKFTSNLKVKIEQLELFVTHKMKHLSREEFRESVSRGDPNCCRVFNSLNRIFDGKSKFNSKLPNYLRRDKDKNWFNSMCLASIEEFYYLVYERRAENNSKSGKFLSLEAADYVDWYIFMINLICLKEGSIDAKMVTFKVLSTMLADYKKKNSTAEEKLLNANCSSLFVEYYLVCTNGYITTTYYSRLIEDNELEVAIFSYLADSLELEEKIWKRNFVLEAMKIARVILTQIRPKSSELEVKDYVRYHEDHFLFNSSCWTKAVKRVLENSCKNKAFVSNLWIFFQKRYEELLHPGYKETSSKSRYQILTLMAIASDLLIDGGLEKEKLKTFITNVIQRENLSPEYIRLALTYLIGCSRKIDYDEETANVIVPYVVCGVKDSCEIAVERESSKALNVLLDNDTSNCIKRVLKPELDKLLSKIVYLTLHYSRREVDECAKLYATIIEMQPQFEQLK